MWQNGLIKTEMVPALHTQSMTVQMTFSMPCRVLGEPCSQQGERPAFVQGQKGNTMTSLGLYSPDLAQLKWVSTVTTVQGIFEVSLTLRPG